MNQPIGENLDLQEHTHRVKRLTRHVWTHFKEDRCLEEAASLSYTSLLSLVPLMAVAFGIISVFPVFNEWSEKLQSFIFDNFMPSTGEQIVPYLTTFLDSVGNLALPGVIALIVTALLLLIRIEVAFNRIWRVDKNRTLLNRVVMYWAVLTLVPILIATAAAFSAQKIITMFGGDAAVSPLLSRLGMFVVTWLVFASVFLLVPHRRVQVQHALAGAFLSTVLFSLAKAGFVAYVSNANYRVIYGALATVPIFLLWLYLVWIVVLFGASLAASLTTFSDYSRYETRWPDRWAFQMVFRLIGHFREAQKRGEGLSREQILELETQASELQLLQLVGSLREEHIITSDDDGNWLLARDLEDLTLLDLYSAGGNYLPISEAGALPRESAWDDVYSNALKLLRDHGEPVWDRTLREMYRDSKTEGTNTHE